MHPMKSYIENYSFILKENNILLCLSLSEPNALPLELENTNYTTQHIYLFAI